MSEVKIFYTNSEHKSNVEDWNWEYFFPKKFNFLAFFQAVDGYVSVTGITRYADSEPTDPEVNEELEHEVDHLQNLLDEDEKRGTPTDAKCLDLEAEIPWEKNHKRVLTMTVDTREYSVYTNSVPMSSVNCYE